MWKAAKGRVRRRRLHAILPAVGFLWSLVVGVLDWLGRLEGLALIVSGDSKVMEFLIGVLSSNTFNIAVLSVALIVLVLLLFWPERPGSTPAFWREAESHFDKIGSNISVAWYRYENDGHVEWGTDGDIKDVERFLGEARIFGRVVKNFKHLPRIFEDASFGDDADHWFNVVVGIFPRPRFTGSGYSDDSKGNYESNTIDDMVRASKAACVRIASMVD